jgi:hypothetical protein
MLILLILSGTMAAIAAANVVPVSGLGYQTRAITPNDLKPPECAGINVTNVVVGSGTISGIGNNDLILGSSIADNINARNGSDCVLGGGQNDTLRGFNGSDILIGGPGNDYLIGGPGYDICYGNAGTDTFDGSCEEQYQ